MNLLSSMFVSQHNMSMTDAHSAIFTLAILGPYVAYGIPIASRLIWPERFVRGPWHCGRLSRPIAAIAVVWMTFAVVIFCL